MVSEFLTLVERLRVPDFVPNHQLLQDKDWPLNENQKPCQYYTNYLSMIKMITGMERK